MTGFETMANNASGGGIISGGSSSAIKTGEHLVVGGLFVQLIFFGLFMVVAFTFDVRIRRVPSIPVRTGIIPWRKHLKALFSASILIVVRSVFRVVEYIQGNDGYILRHEVFLYIFDAVLMFFVMVVFSVIHPSKVKAYLRGGKLSRGGFRLHVLEETHST